jgi:allophanate hydrolase subunit 1
LPRREPPRVRVPAGSVAIAGRQTGIYPSASPGGWNILGRTPLRIVDVEQDHFPIRAGDRIRFVPIDRVEFDKHQGDFLT